MDDKRPIIIIRRKAPAHGHHGGAWKVAYADFVTAMMALFIVLWLMNSSEHVRKAVAGYFNDPAGKTNLTGSDHASSAQNLPLTRDNVDQLKQQLEKDIAQKAELQKLKQQIELTVTPEGLRIELLETKEGTFFESGSSELSSNGRSILAMVAEELRNLPNNLSIEGHTDSKPYAQEGTYSNWELSVDRANSARRNMQEMGIRQNQVSQVRGYADQRLRVTKNPARPIQSPHLAHRAIRQHRPTRRAPTTPRPHNHRHPLTLLDVAGGMWPIQAHRWLEWDRVTSPDSGYCVLECPILRKAKSGINNDREPVPRFRSNLSSRPKQSAVEGSAFPPSWVPILRDAGCPILRRAKGGIK